MSTRKKSNTLQHLPLLDPRLSDFDLLESCDRVHQLPNLKKLSIFKLKKTRPDFEQLRKAVNKNNAATLETNRAPIAKLNNEIDDKRFLRPEAFNYFSSNKHKQHEETLNLIDSQHHHHHNHLPPHLLLNRLPKLSPLVKDNLLNANNKRSNANATGAMNLFFPLLVRNKQQEANKMASNNNNIVDSNNNCPKLSYLDERDGLFFIQSFTHFKPNQIS